MKTEIVDDLYTTDEFSSMLLNDKIILRIQQNEWGEIDFIERLGLIKNYVFCVECFNFIKFTRKTKSKNMFIWACNRTCRK